MLEVCPSEPAEALRDSIRLLAAQGMTSAELVEWMLAGHGEEWRAVPRRQGIGLWAWLLPPAALLLGLGVLVARLSTLRGAAQRHEPDGPELSEAEREELTAALAELEGSGEERA